MRRRGDVNHGCQDAAGEPFQSAIHESEASGRMRKVSQTIKKAYQMRRKKMSLKPQGMAPIPETTARFAHEAFPKGNAIMRFRDALGPIYTDEQFTALFPEDGQPALSPGLLALVTVLQFAEGLSDRQAANAVRARIDWKY